VNNLNVCRSLEYILTEFPKIDDEKGNIDTSKPVHLLPWSEEVPAICQNRAAETDGAVFYPSSWTDAKT
jgi:hypothetical protein